MLQINLHLRDFESIVPKILTNRLIPKHLFDNCWDRCRTPVFDQIVLLNRLIRLNYE